MSRGFLGPIVGLFAWAILAASARACAAPDPSALIRPIDEGLANFTPSAVNVLSAPQPGPGLRWVALSWREPLDGAIFVVDCRGRRVAGRRVGAFDLLRPGPRIVGHATLEAFHHVAGKAKADTRFMALLRFDGRRVNLLWVHESETLTPATPLSEKIVVRWRWRYATNGRHIWTSGKRTIGAPTEADRLANPNLVRRMHPETYCWIPGRQRFSRCRHE